MQLWNWAVIYHQQTTEHRMVDFKSKMISAYNMMITGKSPEDAKQYVIHVNMYTYTAL